jgi:CRP-like cAMP-binding protein
VTPIDARDALRTLLGSQPEAEAAWLLEQVAVLDFEPGSAVVHEGQPARDMFLLFEGRLRLGKQRPDLKQTRIAYLQPVALLGLASAILGTAHPTTAVAVAPARCLRIPRRLLKGGEDPRSNGPARRLLEAAVRGMNAQLRAVNARLACMEDPGACVGDLTQDLGAWSLPEEG